jgi:lysophospholipase L1-like esterase
MIGRFGFWLFLPLSALQGLWLRRTATRLPEAEGERKGECGQGKSLKLLAMGDSIIAGVGTGRMEFSLPVQFARALAERQGCRVQWRVEGENGADISRLRDRIRSLDGNPEADVILISIGVNNVTGLSSTRQWRLQVNALVAELREKWPNARVILAGLPPMGRFPLPPQPLRFTLGLRAATLDAIAAEVISRHAGMLHIPTDIDPLHEEFCEDGFHPSAESCRSWAKELAQRFQADNLDGLSSVKGSK